MGTGGKRYAEGRGYRVVQGVGNALFLILGRAFLYVLIINII